MQTQYLKDYNEYNPEKFNEEFLKTKELDDEKKYLEVAMKTLNSIDGIEYLRMEEVPHRIYEPIENEEERDGLNISIDKSVLKIYKFYFKISKDDREEIINFDLFYPELIKGGYFLINNNRYFPVYQLLDSGFFNTPKAVVLKTLIMPIVMEKKNDTLSLNIFKKKMSPFFYFLAKFGWEETLKFFKIEDDILLSEKLEDLDEDEWEGFEINKKLNCYIKSEAYYKNPLMFNSLLECLDTNRLKINKILEIETWQRKLGMLFTPSTTDKIGKAKSSLVSFERALDPLNQEYLRLDEEDKKDIYHLIRYMIVNYEMLKNRDNCDLANKRIRCHEYLIYPLLKRYTNFVRRINNSRKVKFEKLCEFKPNKGFLVKCAVTNELLRYDNSCNSINIITKLKLSQGGAQSQFASGAVNIAYRANHPSFVGRIGLLATSAGEPGCTATFTPFCELADKMHFTEEENNK